MAKSKHGTHGPGSGGPDAGNPHGHKPHDPPYYDPDYEKPPDHGHEPPDNPRKEDYKPPTRCDDHGHGDELCVRKDHRALTSDEQSRFLNAFTQINAMNALGPLVDIHSNATHQMHSNPRFLPWHRIYLLRLEALLMAVDPTICIPYWKSSEEQAFPSWLIGFTPTVNLIGGPHTVTRNIGAFAFLPNAAAVTAAMANGTFNTFAQAVEGVHNSGHVWVGGSMGIIPTESQSGRRRRHDGSVDRDRGGHARHHGPWVRVCVKRARELVDLLRLGDDGLRRGDARRDHHLADRRFCFG